MLPVSSRVEPLRQEGAWYPLQGWVKLSCSGFKSNEEDIWEDSAQLLSYGLNSINILLYLREVAEKVRVNAHQRIPIGTSHPWTRSTV